MKSYEILLQIILWTISILSGFIAYEFYKSKDGRLRLLIISLFICKIWVYGGAAIMFLIWPPGETTLIRILILNSPMFITMLKLWNYIRTKEK